MFGINIAGNYQQYTEYLPLFVLGLVVSFLLSPIVGFIARKTGTVDFQYERINEHKRKASDFRRLRKPPQALLGGLATIVPLIVLTLLHIGPSQGLSYFIGALFLIIFMGVTDDRYDLSGKTQLLVQVIAALLIVASPINFTHITNPFGGVINLDTVHITTSFLTLPVDIVLIGDLILFGWILICINAVKWSFGTDGVAEGNTIVASFVLFLLSIRFGIHESAVISILFTGLLMGFLFFSFPFGYLRCGTIGKSAYGFIIAVLSLLIGGKLAIAIILLSIPLLDFFRVIVGRIRRHQTLSPGKLLSISDRTHIHHRLLDLGFSERQIFIVEFFASILLGALALAYSGAYRGFILLGSIAGALGILILVKIFHRKNGHSDDGSEQSPEAKYSY